MGNINYYLVLVVLSSILWMARYFSFSANNILYLKTNLRLKSLDRVFLITIFLIGASSFLIMGYGVNHPKVFLGKAAKQEKINDIFILLDTSRSMLANDFSPNRLYVAKKMLRNFLSTRPASRVSLIIFAEKVFMISPLTHDYRFLLNSLDSITVTEDLGDGTNIGDALALAVSKAQNGLSLRKSIVLITDGVAQFESIDPRVVAKDAFKSKIKIHTVGVGTNKNAQIPIMTINGEEKMSLIPGSSFDLNLLKDISKESKGDFFPVTTGNELKQVFSTISKDEELYIKKEVSWLYQDFSYEYLSIGVIMLLISFSLEVFLLRRSL